MVIKTFNQNYSMLVDVHSHFIFDTLSRVQVKRSCSIADYLFQTKTPNQSIECIQFQIWTREQLLNNLNILHKTS